MYLSSVLGKFGYEKPEYRDWKQLHWYNEPLFHMWMAQRVLF